jgi:phage terminase small subunit
MPSTKRARAQHAKKKRELEEAGKVALKHERFCQEYLVDLSASAAARRAGYSEKSAGAQGSRLLKDPKILERIEQLQLERAVRTQVTADRVLHELAVVGFSNVDHYQLGPAGGVVLAGEAPPVAMRAISSVKHRTRTTEDDETIHEVEYRLWDKVGALAKLGDHLGLFKRRVEVTGKDGGPVKTEVVRQVWKFGDQEIEF